MFVTYQDLGVQNLQNFKNYLVELECYQFSTQIASPTLNSPQIKPIYKNINSTYGKICELDFTGFYLESNVCGLNLNVIQIQTKLQTICKTKFKSSNI
jgi:hypothetical protein